MRFEWDIKKDEINFLKHKVRFERAILVWTDEKRIERYDYSHSEREDRWHVIGYANELLFVVYTERKDEIIRIISARKANKREIDEYYKNYDIR